LLKAEQLKFFCLKTFTRLMKAAVLISLRKIAGLKTVINNFLGHCTMEVTHLTYGDSVLEMFTEFKLHT
jgi:hypothetical protein